MTIEFPTTCPRCSVALLVEYSTPDADARKRCDWCEGDGWIDGIGDCPKCGDTAIYRHPHTGQRLDECWSCAEPLDDSEAE